jgi:hypothetical protein
MIQPRRYSDEDVEDVYDHDGLGSSAHAGGVVSEEEGEQEGGASSDGELADLIKDSIRRSLKSAVLSS